MQAITFDQCVTGAWKDTWRAAQQNPQFVIFVFATYYLLNIAAKEFARMPALGALWFGLSFFILSLLKLLTLSVLAVQTQRYVLLDERRWDGRTILGFAYWRYAALTCAAGACFVLVAITTGLLSPKQKQFGFFALPDTEAIAAGACALFLFLAWMHLRLSLLFPHAAIGRPLSWKGAFLDTRGNGWAIIGTYFVLAITFTFASFIPLLLWFLLSSAMGGTSFYAIGELINAGYVVAMVAVTSACSGWIYRRFARQLTRSTIVC